MKPRRPTRREDQAALQDERLDIIYERDLNGQVCDKILGCLKAAFESRGVDFLKEINPFLADYSNYLNRATQEKINTKEAANLLRDLVTFRLLQASITAIQKKQARSSGLHTAGRQTSDLLNELLRLEWAGHRDSAELRRRDSAIVNILVSMLVDTVQNYSERGYGEQAKSMVKGLFCIQFDPAVVNHGTTRVHTSAISVHGNQANLYAADLNRHLDATLTGIPSNQKKDAYNALRQECIQYAEAIIEELCKASGTAYVDIFAAHLQICSYVGQSKQIEAEELIKKFKTNLEKMKSSSFVNSNAESNQADEEMTPSLETVMFHMHLRNIIRKLKTFLTSS
jgi:hypothetical protein